MTLGEIVNLSVELPRAIVLEEPGGTDIRIITELSEPEPRVGHVVIQVRAFAINHAELHMCRSECAEATSQPPRMRGPRKTMPGWRRSGRAKVAPPVPT